MKKTKLMSLVLALVMLLGVAMPAFAAGESDTKKEDEKTTTVYVHKMLMTKEQLDAHDVNKEGYDGNQITNLGTFFGEGATEIPGVYFVVEKEFDVPDTTEGAEDVATVKEWKAVTSTGAQAQENLSDALAGLTKKITIKENTNEEQTFTALELDTSNLPAGTYRINEVHDKSEYVGKDGKTLTDMKAVPTEITLPLVNDNGVVTEAHVYPKNTEEKPEIDKNFLQNNELTAAEQEAANKLKVGADYKNYQEKKATAKAEIGKNIPYEVKTKIPAKSNLKEAHWDDKMTEGLTFNEDLEVKIGTVTYKTLGTDETASETIKAITDIASLEQNERGFSLRLNDEGLKLINGQDEAVTVELKYSATVNKDAIADIPEANDIIFHYGNTPSKGTTPVPTKPNENGEVSVEKAWDNGSEWQDGEYAKFKLVDANTGEDVKAEDLVNAPEDYTFEGTVKLEKDGNHTYTWKYLNKDKQYKVVEVESKTLSDAAYTVNEQGKIEVTNHKSNNPKPLNPTEPKVVNGGKKFVKTNQDGTERLAGAEFYVKNAEGKYLVADQKDSTAVTNAKKALDEAVKTYNNLEVDEQTAEEKAKVTSAQEAYNKAFKENATNYKWEDKADNAVVLTSDGEGKFEITGLEYGTYYLEEKTAPKGFAKLTGEIEFKVEKGSYAGTAEEFKYEVKLEEGETQTYGLQVKNKKVSIPQTGGMGTIIFVVAGLALMGGAAIAMKKNKSRDNQ